VDRIQAARYQINGADVQDAVQTVAGGSALTQVLQGEAREGGQRYVAVEYSVRGRDLAAPSKKRSEASVG